MATKLKSNAVNGMHTAGIFSDMTVDGPEIGTLVIIVDRAKNLPNLKTIGKQDPYCAARLGKEAKKTETDRRGGQTPKWDQELRFTVHDSPDYYQLKVSVFNDDKRTDLIGETWVNLQEVVVPGGGQSDIWHSLSCKGKYAGEVRIEITYYDTRPKQERPADKARNTTSTSAEDGPKDSLKGPRQPQQKTPVKRRPLPSDPVTGAPAPSPVATRDHVPTPPRGYSQPAPGALEHVQGPVRGYSAPSVIPEHVQTPPRNYQNPSYIPNQSPLQNLEYNTPPPHHFSQSQSYDNVQDAGDYEAPPRAVTPIPRSPQDDVYNGYDPRNSYSYGNGPESFGDNERIEPTNQYGSYHSPYELPQPDEFGSPPSPGGPPPPPPAHRSRHGSNQPSPAHAPSISSHGSYGFSDARVQNGYHPAAHEAHRHSMPENTQRHQYQAYSTPEHDETFLESSHHDYQQSPRHHSYDSRYEHSDYTSMQPTVEDAPPSPGAGNYAVSPRRRSSGFRAPQYEDRGYDPVPSPAPLNLSGRGSAASGQINTSATPSHKYSSSSMGYATSNSPSSYRDRAGTESSLSSHTSYNPLPQHHQPYRRQSEDPTMGSQAQYGLPPVPATLVAGMDPIIAQEISDRIYEEKRAIHGQSAGNSPRGRQQNQYQATKPHPLSYHEAVPTPFVPNTVYDDHQSRFTNATTPVVKPRAISPNPQRPIRKSVSPSPAPPESDERRLSGIPFGPDSYNALNPSISSSVSTPSLSSKYDTKEVDPNAKIITHDGREIDPSDHIPESNYAPLLETKGPKYASQLPDRNYRPPPSTTSQQPSASGRTPFRQAGRPLSMASSPIYSSGALHDPPTPPNRNRLQKKANRMSTQPGPHSSPLAPISPYQDNSYTPRSQTRVNGADYHANENYAPQYGGSPGYRGPTGPPPIPAKVPMAMGGGPQQHPPPGSGDPWALLEEMKNIDLGSGRARRRGN